MTAFLPQRSGFRLGGCIPGVRRRIREYRPPGTRRDLPSLSGEAVNLIFKPAPARILVETLEVPGRLIGVHLEAVVRERVDERCVE
jgi:hypothetical protein